VNLTENLFYGASAIIQQRAKELWKCMTDAEKILWKELRRKKVGYKFRRQHPINSCIADFYCHEKKLVIEVDSGIHNGPENIEYDCERTKDLSIYGIKEIRYFNTEIIKYLPAVIEDIRNVIENRKG
jgi:cyclase